MNTPSPELMRTKAIYNTPKSICRKILGSPGFLAKGFSDIGELSMSPLQLLDSPIPAAPLTPLHSSGETPKLLNERVEQTSTPSESFLAGTSSIKNKAFVISANIYTSVKAKRRLINDENHSAANTNPAPAKKPKTTPAPYSRAVSKNSHMKRRSLGQINAGVSHKIRRPKPSRKVLAGKKLGKSFDSTVDAKQEITPVKPVENTRKKVVADPAAELGSSMLSSSSMDQISLMLQQNVTPKANNHSNERARMVEKKPATVPKVITRHWNRNRQETKERKFFKSRDSQDSPNRIVTVSVNDNLKLQICEKEPAPKVATRKSPRKLQRNIMEPYKPIEVVEQKQLSPPIIPSHSINIDILHQDWNDDTEDISTNIQEILDGLSVEDPIDSPKKSAAFKVEEKEKNTGVNKLFPLFNRNSNKPAPPLLLNSTQTCVPKNVLKSQWQRARKEGENQMIMDAGQKTFGAIQCKECQLVYHAKEPEDELLHVKFHESFQDVLKFAGWKKEKVIRRYSLGRYVIVIQPNDPAYCWNKVHSVLKNVVDNELGFSEIGIRNLDATKVYFYIADKKIVGVLVAEGIGRGYRMLAATEAGAGKCCSSEPEPVVCGISRIWTLASYRRHKVATRLLDVMRSEFVYGKFVSHDEMAFSDPTENGLAFAQSYTKRTDFLVYNM